MTSGVGRDFRHLWRRPAIVSATQLQLVGSLKAGATGISTAWGRHLGSVLGPTGIASITEARGVPTRAAGLGGTPIACPTGRTKRRRLRVWVTPSRLVGRSLVLIAKAGVLIVGFGPTCRSCRCIVRTRMVWASLAASATGRGGRGNLCGGSPGPGMVGLCTLAVGDRAIVTVSVGIAKGVGQAQV